MFRQTESESHMGSFEKVGYPGQLSSNIWGVGARYELLRLLQVLSGLTTSGLESQETSLQRSIILVDIFLKINQLTRLPVMVIVGTIPH